MNPIYWADITVPEIFRDPDPKQLPRLRELPEEYFLANYSHYIRRPE
jgi:hypothetical protein